MPTLSKAKATPSIRAVPHRRSETSSHKAIGDSVSTPGQVPPAGWTAIPAAQGATLRELAMGSTDLADQIQHANLARPGWDKVVQVKAHGFTGWLHAVFGGHSTARQPRYGVDTPLPAGTQVWVPKCLDPDQQAPKGYRRIALPPGSWSLAKLTGGYPDLAEALSKGNPDLASSELARGGLYINVPDALPLAHQIPALPDRADRAAAPEIAKIGQHLKYVEDPHMLDPEHGTLSVRPGDTPESLAKLIFNDATRWKQIAPDARPGTDLAASGWTAVSLPAAYRAPDWGDIMPLHPVDPFLQKLAPAAARIEAADGIPAAVTLAQAAVESAMGTAKIGEYNVFGIKGSGSRGSLRVWTQEYVHGRRIEVRDNFANYGSWQEAMAAHARVFDAPAYARARQYPHDPVAFAKALNGIYATDPHYAATLIQVMKEQDLIPN